MSGYGAREARINREREARVNLCGDCGTEIADTELLCHDCDGRWERVSDASVQTISNA